MFKPALTIACTQLLTATALAQAETPAHPGESVPSEEQAPNEQAPTDAGLVEGASTEEDSSQAEALDGAVDEEEPTYEGVAEVEAPPREATKRTLKEEELTTIPGTRGDAVRAVEVMPGVARTQFGTNPGAPPLRGSPPSESLILLDGAPMPLLFHFGGLTSVFNSHLLESVTLYPGTHSVRYGRAAGGMVDLRVRDPRSDGPHLLVDVSAIDSSAVAETPVGEHTQIALGARRSNVDLFFDALISDDSTAVIASPVYWDYQGILAHELAPGHELRLIAYGASDAFELHFGEAVADDPGLQGGFGSTVSFHRLQVEYAAELGENVRQELMVASGYSPGTGDIGSVHYDYDSFESTARGIWSFLPTHWLGLDAGFDVQLVNVEFVYEGPAPASDEGVPVQGSVASEGINSVRSSLHAARPAGFVEASLRPVPEWLLVPGVRVDYMGESSKWSVDPRLSSRLEVGPDTVVKAAAGLHTQPPQYWENLPAFGNPELDPYRTLQTSLGVEQAFGRALTADLETFYKHWSDRILSTLDGAPPYYVNAGTGDAYGLEVLLDAQPTDDARALLAYTLSRSTRQDGPNEPTRLFDDDQTHNVSLVASYELGRGWLAGARFRYVTGNPYSSVQGAVYDASTDTYRPLYGAINDARNPDFHQLDVRVEKEWVLGAVDLTAYLEVMNVYDRQNQESRRYSFDYRESASVSGMPFFPNLGIKGEL